MLPAHGASLGMKVASTRTAQASTEMTEGAVVPVKAKSSGAGDQQLSCVTSCCVTPCTGLPMHDNAVGGWCVAAAIPDGISGGANGGKFRDLHASTCQGAYTEV